MIELETAVYFCQEDDGVCQTSGVVTRIPVSAAATDGQVTVTHAVKTPNRKTKTSLTETAAAIL